MNREGEYCRVSRCFRQIASVPAAGERGARVDARTGQLRWDETLKSADGVLGISLRRARWPHGATGDAFGHAALFRP